MVRSDRPPVRAEEHVHREGHDPDAVWCISRRTFVVGVTAIVGAAAGGAAGCGAGAAGQAAPVPRRSIAVPTADLAIGEPTCGALG